MKKRKLGKSGLEVSAIGMGCMNLSFGTGKAVAINEGVKVIRAGYEKGITFLTPLRRTAPSPMRNWSARHLSPFARRSSLPRSSA
jgi:hypothetical protein